MIGIRAAHCRMTNGIVVVKIKINIKDKIKIICGLDRGGLR